MKRTYGTLKSIRQLAFSKGLTKVIKDKETGEKSIVLDMDKVSKDFAPDLTKKHRNWKNKKEMKLFKKQQKLYRLMS